MNIDTSERLSEFDWLTHGFFSPGAGSSNAKMDNCSFQCGAAETVLSARRNACGSLAVDAANLTFVYQEHGIEIVCVEEKDRGAGADPSRERLGPADGLYTESPGVPLGILVADCLPVFIADPERRRVGLLHSGWRSTHGDISGALVERWVTGGASPKELVAWIGPGIEKCCFEVGGEVLEAFAERYPEWQDTLVWRTGARTQEPGAGTIDLKEIVLRQLLRRGLEPSRVEVSRHCTMCGAGYFSYRRDGPGVGHNMAVMMVRPKVGKVLSE